MQSKWTEKSYANQYSPRFFMLSALKSFEILPNQNKYEFNSESFALNW